MVKYRKATIDDIETLIKLRIEFLKEAQNILNNEQDFQIKNNSSDYFNKSIINEEFIGWLAIIGDEIIATSGLCFYTIPPSYKNQTGKIAYIMNMYTKPNYRRQGIAKELFKRTIEESKILGIKKIVLHATSDGRPLYEKFDFENNDEEMVLLIK